VVKLTFNEKKKAIKYIIHDIFVGFNIDETMIESKLLKKIVDSFATNNNEKEKLLNVIKEVWNEKFKEEYGTKKFKEEYNHEFEDYIKFGDNIEQIKKKIKILLSLVRNFPELKEWVKQQFDPNLIKRVIEKLIEISKLAKNPEVKEFINNQIVKKSIANLVACFDIDEYFLWLFA